jgi:hypothetical protein
MLITNNNVLEEPLIQYYVWYLKTYLNFIFNNFICCCSIFSISLPCPFH